MPPPPPPPPGSASFAFSKASCGLGRPALLPTTFCALRPASLALPSSLSPACAQPKKLFSTACEIKICMTVDNLCAPVLSAVNCSDVLLVLRGSLKVDC